MNITQETLPAAKGWVQAKTIEEFKELLKVGKKVYFRATTCFDRNSEDDLVDVCGSTEGIFIDNIHCEKASGWLEDFLPRVYPEVRKAMNMESKALQNIAESIGAGLCSRP